MKNLLSVCTLLLFQLSINAQTAYIQSSGQGAVHHLKSVTENLTIGIVSSCYTPEGYIIAIDSLGEKQWTHRTIEIAYRDIFISEENEIIITGIESNSFGTSFVIKKLDHNGEEMNSNYIEIFNNIIPTPFESFPYSSIEHPYENGLNQTQKIGLF